MKKKLSHIMATMLVALSVMPVSAIAASADTIKINDVTDKFKGDKVTITGASTLQQVSIKVLNPDGTVLYFDVVKTANGSYFKEFTLPMNAQTGTYTIVAGTGTTVATDLFDIILPNQGGGSDGGGTGGGDNPGGGTGGGDNPGGGTGGGDNPGGGTGGGDNPGGGTGGGDNPGGGTGGGDNPGGGTGGGDNPGGGTGGGDNPGGGTGGGDNPGGGTGGGNGGSSSTGSTTTPSNTEAVQDIKDGKWLALNDKGNLSLPAAAVDKLGDAKLKVQSGDLTVEIPAANIKSLIAGLSSDALKDATITVNIAKKQTADIESLISKAETAGQLVLTSAGEMIDITLSVSTKDGKTNKISQLTEPVTISFKLKAGANAKLAGIYYINDNGELEYVGGTVANSTIQAELQHFSVYGVLEYNKSFSDVPATHWAYDIIKELSAKHIVNGTTDALFMPESQVTRSEFVALLTRALQLKSTPIYNNTFADVSPNEWYASSVQSAVQAGLVTGTSETTFEPNKPITREEMVTLIVRAYEKNHGVQSAPSKSVSFTDASQIHDWAQPFVNKAANLGIIATDTAQFNPLDHATRAESSKVVSSILSK